ncbi:hypothetical protein GCM10023335_59090 [Streptomyces siamensis]|uniref:Uncharacterized protein n=1 Tax=Streptomyces siamensis TaxID=1274986 RepID=A0ABP9JCF0_9ACTN
MSDVPTSSQFGAPVTKRVVSIMPSFEGSRCLLCRVWHRPPTIAAGTRTPGSGRLAPPPWKAPPSSCGSPPAPRAAVLLAPCEAIIGGRRALWNESLIPR